MAVADQTLAFERGCDWRSDVFGELQNLRHLVTRSRSNDDQWPRRRCDHRQRFGQDISRGSNQPGAHSPSGSAGLDIGSQDLHLVGQHDVGNIAFNQRGLARQAHDLCWVCSRMDCLAKCRHVGEGPFEVKILKGTATLVLRWDLPREREHRRSVDLGVVEASEQIG